MSLRNLLAEILGRKREGKKIFSQRAWIDGTGVQVCGARHEARVARAKLRLSQQAFSREKLEADWSSVLEVKPIRYGGAREMVMTMVPRW